MVTNTETASQFALNLKPKIVSYLFHKHRQVSIEDAEDMAMLAITGFALKFDAGRGFAPITYLYSCVNNEYRTWRRANLPTMETANAKLRQNKWNTDSIQQIEAGMGGEMLLPVDDMGFASIENKDMLRNALSRLTDKEKQVLKCLLAGMTLDEMSVATKISRAYVRHVKERLREKLGEHLGVNISDTMYAKRQAAKFSRKKAA